MSNTDRSTVTRRTALQAGTLAAIAAGRLGATTPPAVAAEPAPLVLGTVTDTAPLVADSMRLARLCRETLLQAADAGEDLGDTFTPEQDALFRAYDDALGAHHSATIALYLAEFYRHVPGLAPALFAVGQHIQEGFNAVGACCVPTGDES
jgi:hypothetical protein